MKCNCISEMKEKLKNELPEKNRDYSNMKINSVDCDCESFLLGKKTVRAIFIPFTINHDPIRRKTNTTVKLTANYCPFCGTEIEKD